MAGLIYKISCWFRYTLGPDTDHISFSKRVIGALKGIVLTLFSSKILTLLRVFLLDVLFQVRTFKQNRYRWAMHICIYWGFMGLLLMHALESFITSSLFPDYASTLNPFLFLRSLFFFVVMVGLGMAVYRRLFLKVPRLMTSPMDHYVIIILAVIMISGVFLEGAKISSFTEYQNMVDEYADLEDDEAGKALESYWVQYYGVVSPHVKAPFDEEVLTLGEEINDESCISCHSRPQWAFTGYTVAKITKPIALALDRAGASTILWYIHFLACFIGLAYLPFSKMFHIIAGPLSLLANAVMEDKKSDPANIATRQIMELDACTHCGTCSSHCLVGVCFERIPNINILPSEKLGSVKAFVSGKRLSETEIKSILEGLYFCTNCTRCTVVCPGGINLQELWFNVREKMLKKGYPELLTLSSFSLYRGLKWGKNGHRNGYRLPIKRAMEAIAESFPPIETEVHAINLREASRRFKRMLGDSKQGNTFSYCYTCTTCSTSCPVVRNYENPPEVLDLVPHQIIHASALGVTDMVFNSKMLWSCLGCYQCQESCPQGVRVTDVFY